MLAKASNTWTILFCAVIPLFVLGLPLTDDTNNTMYDTLKEKCPSIDKTTLKENEIFKKNCLSWENINATSSFSVKTKNNVECLIVYESLLSFCTGMGDKIAIPGLIPSLEELKRMGFNLTQMCVGNDSLLKDLLPMKKMEHNISSLVQNSDDCLLLCSDFSVDSRVSVTCQFAHYFANFDISKFSSKLEKLHSSSNITEHAEQAVQKLPQLEGTALKNNLTATVIGNDKTQSKINDSPLKVNSNNVTDLSGLQAAVGQQNNIVEQNQNVDSNAKDHKDDSQAKPAENPSLPETSIKITKPSDQNQIVINEENSVKSPNDAEKNNKDSQSIPQIKEEDVGKKSQPEAPEEAIVPETNLNNPEQDPDLYGNDEKPQKDPEAIDEDDDDGMPEDGDMKEEPALPSENEQPKMPQKKVKPNTVEDELVNSFNTSEDNMDGDSYFFSYFTVIMCLFIVGYVGYHNRQKILALILEGKKGRRSGRSRRPNSANYHKLDTNLEEAISSSCTKNANNVIY